MFFSLQALSVSTPLCLSCMHARVELSVFGISGYFQHFLSFFCCCLFHFLFGEKILRFKTIYFGAFFFHFLPASQVVYGCPDIYCFTNLQRFEYEYSGTSVFKLRAWFQFLTNCLRNTVASRLLFVGPNQ